ncbi:MAG: YicC family protein [Balneolaceae bacterium]|nr:YicC family protein [Balneolaceae bacterium]MBO6546735.1 YicC family protein [Balneolaceae bacterium]MBO6649093.1 YicC family protein [Balneolaceae bacterium]
MTGFGRGEAADNGLNATVELKSLNSRYLDITTRLPQRLQNKELAIKELVQKFVSRGKLNITVYVSEQDSGEPSIQVDEKKAKAYAKLLNQLRETTGIETPLNIKNITSFSDVFVTPEEDEESLKRKWELVKKALENGLSNLMEMRTQEGNQLKHDLIDRINAIDGTLDEILEITESRSEEVRKKLHERIKQLIDDENIDEERLEMEVVIMADKMDITEETVRLRAHLKFFIEAIEQPEPAGRRLNFLTQEINRELNTIGSKANDSGIAHHVVKAKEMLEQIREQVQNVE